MVCAAPFLEGAKSVVLVIPSLFDQDPWAQSRRPSDMMRQG
jgi:hypothetical protein